MGRLAASLQTELRRADEDDIDVGALGDRATRVAGVGAVDVSTEQMSSGVDRRIWVADPNARIVACVEFDAMAAGATPSAHSDVLRDLAVRRLERCIRPGDSMCMLGGNRVAVLFGNGGHRVSKGVLGRRLARAMGDHLAVGADSVDVRVAVGVSAGTGDADESELVRSAVRAARRAHLKLQQAGDPEAHAIVTVTHMHGDRDAATHDGREDESFVVHRISKRVSDSLDGPADRAGTKIADNGTLRQVTGTVPRVLLVDPGAVRGAAPRLAVEAVAATVRGLGARTTVSPSSDPDRVLLDLYVSEPHAVVVVLQTDAYRSNPASLAGRTWDDLSVLVRSLRDTGVPIIAVSVGASAAAVAACMEQGAIGLLEAEELPQELASVVANAGFVAASNGGSGNGYAQADAFSRRFPAPFAALVGLTPSERRVLFHMMEGLSASEIAEVLVVSLPTVRSHIRSILRKLNVNSQLAAVAIAHGTSREAAVGA